MEQYLLNILLMKQRSINKVITIKAVAKKLTSNE